MAKEIERKFLVVGDAWRALAKGTHYRQGYLNSMKERTVRIRTIDDKAFMTIKGPTVGVTRMEFEYEIPHAECVEMLTHLAEQPIIEKAEKTLGITEKDASFFGEFNFLFTSVEKCGFERVFKPLDLQTHGRLRQK